MGSVSVKYLRSFGGVVYKIQDEAVWVVVCHRREPSLYALPKGTPDIGETKEETAIREVREETGLGVKIEGDIGDIHYSFLNSKHSVLYKKSVRFFLMTQQGGDIKCHDKEFDDVEWTEFKVALQRLSYTSEIKILKDAHFIIKGIREVA